MYLPSHFEESDPQALHALIRDYPLGLLVSHGEAGLDANHLPFELSPAKGAQGTLEAHVARNNPVWSELRDGDEVLVVFRAGDAYISPQWYPSKQEHRCRPGTTGWSTPTAGCGSATTNAMCADWWRA